MFTIHNAKDDPYSGIIRFKGRAAGEYHIGKDDDIEVNITKDTAKKQIDEMFGGDEEKVKDYFQELADNQLVAQFKEYLIERGKEDNSIVAILLSGAGRIYHGLEPTKENVQRVLEEDDVMEVLNGQT